MIRPKHTLVSVASSLANGLLNGTVRLNTQSDKSVEEAETAASGQLMEAYGLTPEPKEEPAVIRGSFPSQFTFSAKDKIASEEFQHLKEELLEAVRQQPIDAPGAINLEKRAQAASLMIATLGPFENAVIRIGDLLMLKVTREEKPHLIIETLSPEVTRQLEESPLLTQDPDAVFKFFEERHRPQKIQAEGRAQIEGSEE